MDGTNLKVPGVTVSRLRAAHIPPILDLMNAEGWYYYDQRELGRYGELSQECFVLLRDDEVIGSIFTTNHGNQAWLGNIVVAPAVRGLGLAGHLIREVMRHLRAERGVPTFRLGSVPLAIGLYKRIGFRAEAFTTAQEATLPLRPDDPTADLGADVRVTPLREEDLDAAGELDARFFKSRRLPLLQALHAASLAGSRVCLKQGERLVGFLMIRRRQASKQACGFTEGPDHAYRLGPACVEPEYGLAGFQALFRAALTAVHHEARELGGTAKMYVVFPRNAVRAQIHGDTRDLARALGMDAELDLDQVFDQHAHIFGAPSSRKNTAQWEYMRRRGFHQEYFEQVMSHTPGEAAEVAADHRAAQGSQANQEGIFASATPGDKA